MNENRKKIGVAVTVVMLAAIAAAGILVFAESGGTSDGAAASEGSTTFLAKVAKNLGIDEAKLAAAFNAAREQTIDEALAAGRITEEQAAAMRERLEAETAMDDLVAEGIASGKITREQAELLGGRGMGGPMMMGRGSAGGRGFGGLERASGNCESDARPGRR